MWIGVHIVKYRGIVVGVVDCDDAERVQDYRNRTAGQFKSYLAHATDE
jgi:hypothetical protein